MHIQNGLKKCLWRLNLQWVEVDSEATQLPKWVEIFSKDPKSQWVKIFSEGSIYNGFKSFLKQLKIYNE